MITAVITANILITLSCLYIAWQLIKLRRTLAKVTHNINAAERSTHNVLHPAPKNIIKGQTGTRQARKQYQKLQTQLQQIQKILSLFSLTQNLWRRSNKARKNLKKR
ncbi:hypothetical protein NG798_14580 [Ancylothrix sp. C2]|uniref:hypothetical protein n=1 Tax=Ancylothrix sp. D3o TaxID=2953691 RepID=UPI0021BA4133|nr:hypothetical protein [Ancylothrix sp. D3o]MCT7951022.1 hypothetical protein [Ancylothrix sp. D3o]